MQLGNHFLLQKVFGEHHHWQNGGERIDETELEAIPPPILFKDEPDCICVQINQHRQLNTSYYIGIDWISPGKAIYVQPKYNSNGYQTDYLAMLSTALKHPGVCQHTANLFEIKFNQPSIEIPQQHDLLTPLLVVQFLQLVKEIVRKGVRKSYYKVTQNLQARIKGKVVVADTIKQNLLKNKKTHTICSHDEFGLNSLENRLLKKALCFVQRCLPHITGLQSAAHIQTVLDYINPAFETISAEVSMHEVKSSNTNPFYKEYERAIQMAKVLLKRFGYNIANIQETIIKTPPFWIDMSKLFELYVLGLLKDQFGNKVDYHLQSYWNELDFILKDEQLPMVIDAKYKRYDKKRICNQDIRQISGYARLTEVYKALNQPPDKLLNCLIIHPDIENGCITFNRSLLTANPVSGYQSLYQIGVTLPLIKTK